jgi:hypothetical protein
MFFPETLPVVPQLIWYGLKIIFLQNTLVSTEKLHHVTFPDRGVFFFCSHYQTQAGAENRQAIVF